MKKKYLTPKIVTIDLCFTQPLLNESTPLESKDADVNDDGDYIDPLSHIFDCDIEF